MVDINVVATGFIHLLASQVLARLLTFSLNLLIARHLSPEAYGLSSVQFHLVITTIMMLSREGFRRGCLRFQPQKATAKGAGSDAKESKEQQKSEEIEPLRVLSVAWLVIPIGAVVAAGVCGFVLRAAKHQEQQVPGYTQAVVLHGVSAVLELLGEPFYLLSAVNLNFKLRVVMDTLPLAVRSAVTLAAVSGWAGPRLKAMPPALVFSVAQLMLGIVSFLGYALAVGVPLLLQRHRPEQQAKRSVIKQGSKADSGKADTRQAATDGGAAVSVPEKGGVLGSRWGQMEREVLSTTAIFSVQAAEKLVLAEGSKFVMAGLSSSYDQGVMGLVTNLGSLVVRTLFQPLEEVAFAAFSRYRVSTPSSGDTAALQQLGEVLGFMVKGVVMLGLAAVSFGPPFAWLAIRIVYGPTWAGTAAPQVLSVYCLYILLLALNGVTEAFVHAVLDQAGLALSNLLMVAFTAIHLVACWVLINQMGTVGLVAADAINMCLRIGLSLWYIHRYFRTVKAYSLASLAPSIPTIATFMAVLGGLLLSEAACLGPLRSKEAGQLVGARKLLRMAAPHVVAGIASLALLAAVLRHTERSTLRALVTLWRSRRQGAAAPSAAESKSKSE